MSSTSETSFGARLRRAQDLITYIQGFTGYAPPRPQESLTNFTTLVNTIIATNASASSNKQQFTTVVSQRQAAFRGTSTSLQKMLVPIKGAVEAQFGKKAVETTSIAGMIRKMRAAKLIKPTLNSIQTTETDPNTPEEKKPISNSEQSYGSMTQMFNDVISALGQFTGYNPSNPALKITGLQAMATQLTNLNNSVAQKTQALKTTRTTRLNQYTDLQDRVQRIKSYVKAQYGINSNEFTLIKAIKI